MVYIFLLVYNVEKAMAPHSSTLAWKIPWAEGPGGHSPQGRTESDTTERLHFTYSMPPRFRGCCSLSLNRYLVRVVLWQFICLWFRLEVKDKTEEVHLLNDTLASEQKKSRELQWALEKEKAKQGRSEERDKEELEVLFSLSLNVCGRIRSDRRETFLFLRCLPYTLHQVE